MERWKEHLINKIIAGQKTSNAVFALHQIGIHINDTPDGTGTIDYSPEDKRTINAFLNRRAEASQQAAFDKAFDSVNSRTVQSAKNELQDGVLAYYKENWKLHLLSFVVSAVLVVSAVYILLFLFALAINDQHLMHFLSPFASNNN